MIEIHMLEPTLADEAGHCHSYIQSLIEANASGDFELHVWLARRGRKLYRNLPVQKHAYFFRRWRQWQRWFCLRYLIKKKKNIFIPTAGRVDLIFLNKLLGRKIYSSKIFLHFHQFKINDAKVELLKKIAKQHPELIILAPTDDLLSIFRQSGFSQCECVPCPGYSPSSFPVGEAVKFEKILFAGSARVDKGFPEVVRFVEYMKQRIPSIPMEIQISPPVSGRYDKASEAALLRLRNVGHPKLTLHERTLSPKAYQSLFQNAICLLIYDPAAYRNKFSGVALDAFYAACPVISVEETWTGKTTARFDAGISINQRTPEAIFLALNKIRLNYSQYAENAKQASRALQKEHDPINTLNTLKTYLSLSNE